MEDTRETVLDMSKNSYRILIVIQVLERTTTRVASGLDPETGRYSPPLPEALGITKILCRLRVGNKERYTRL